MGILKRLTDAVTGSSSRRKPAILIDGDPSDPYSFEIVGEGPRQAALCDLISGSSEVDRGGYEVEALATLVREPKNPHDPNAVAVHINGRHVGYFAREEAAEFASQLDDLGRSGGTIVARSLIVGGFPLASGSRANLGVKLDLPGRGEPEPKHDSRKGVSTGQGSPERLPEGFHGGKHYTEHVEDVKALKRHGALGEAAELLLHLIEAVEAEASHSGSGVAPWYYELIAIVRRKPRDFVGEIELLERYDSQPKTPGPGPDKLRERLEKARINLERRLKS